MELETITSASTRDLSACARWSWDVRGSNLRVETRNARRAIRRSEGVRENENPGGFLARYDFGYIDQFHDSGRIEWYRDSA